MKQNRWLRALLWPPMAVVLLLLPVAAAALVYAFLRLEEQSALRIGAYALSAYTLTVWCIRIPAIVRWISKFQQGNPYARRWLTDTRLRVNVTLCANAVWNLAYGGLQLGLGIYHGSFWFWALAVYYASLAVMRLSLLRCTVRHAPGADMGRELRHYRGCGRVLLLTNLALSAIVFFMVFRGHTVRHHEITTIAMAAYTFTSLTMAIINLVRYRRLGSPAFSASRAISLASACVSMLTLEGTMLETFGGAEMTAWTKTLFLGLSGLAICALIVAMAIYMIVHGGRTIKELENEYGRSGNL